MAELRAGGDGRLERELRLEPAFNLRGRLRLACLEVDYGKRAVGQQFNTVSLGF